MIHVFKSETMAGEFNACDLCNHTTLQTHKCLCQCTVDELSDPILKALSEAEKVAEDYAPDRFEPDMKVRIYTGVSA